MLLAWAAPVRSSAANLPRGSTADSCHHSHLSRFAQRRCPKCEAGVLRQNCCLRGNCTGCCVLRAFSDRSRLTCKELRAPLLDWRLIAQFPRSAERTPGLVLVIAQLTIGNRQAATRKLRKSAMLHDRNERRHPPGQVLRPSTQACFETLSSATTILAIHARIVMVPRPDDNTGC